MGWGSNLLSVVLGWVVSDLYGSAVKVLKTAVVIETADTVYEQGAYRPVLVEAHPLHANVRLKGMRSSYDVPWSSIWAMGAKMEAERVRREKRKR